MEIPESTKKTKTSTVSIVPVIQIFVGLGFLTAIIALGAFQLIPEFLFIAAIAFAWLALL